MTEAFIKFDQVSYQYHTMTQPTFQDVSVHFREGWTGIVGANGSGKTTFLKLALGDIKPDSGFIETPSFGSYCEQRTDNIPDKFKNFLESWDTEVFRLKGQLDIEPDWLERWDSLSHGERKRAQIACILWQKPEILAIDEPTNHIDHFGRIQLIHSLKSFQGVGLIVSHDRELLETLCQGNVFLSNSTAVYQPGSYSAGKIQIEQYTQQQHKIWDQADAELKKLKKRAASFRSKASHANRHRSKKGISAKDHDTKSRIDAARVTGKDALAGKAMNQLQGRIKQITNKKERVSIQKQFKSGITQKGDPSHKKIIFQIPEGSINSNHQLIIKHSGLVIQARDKIAVIGKNGSGKSTLVNYLINQLSKQHGHLIVLPQEIAAEQSKGILAEIKSLSNEQLGEIMTIVRRLGSDPGRLLESERPSPGELRKLLIALGVLKKPRLMILDEPTNHLDLPSIESLEIALKKFEAALIIVSHDLEFLNQTTRIVWSMTKNNNQATIVVNY